jgi:hypothetical protein
MTTRTRLKINVTAMIVLIVACAAPGRAAWPVKFSDGTVVEIIGISESSDGATPWWAPDGSEAKDPQFQSFGTFSGGGGPGTRPLQLVVKASPAAMAGKGLVVRVEPDFDEGLLKMRDPRGELLRVIAPAPVDKPTFNVRFGLAGGAWTETVLWQRDGAAATQPADGAMKLLGITESDGQTLVRLQPGQPPARPSERPASAAGARPPRRLQSSGGGSGGSGGRGGPGGGAGGIMPGGPVLSDLMFGGSPQDQKLTVIANGRKLQPVGYEGGGDAITVRFRCPKGQVEKVILSSRPYEWLEMQQVSAHPSPTSPTQVKVVPLRKPEATTSPVTENAR